MPIIRNKKRAHNEKRRFDMGAVPWLPHVYEDEQTSDQPPVGTAVAKMPAQFLQNSDQSRGRVQGICLLIKDWNETAISSADMGHRL